MCTGFWWKNLIVRDHLKDLGLGGRLMLNWILKEKGLECVDKWVFLSECSNEPSGSIKSMEFLD